MAEESEQLRFAPGPRNSKVAIYKGYMFQRDKVQYTTTYFACRRRKQDKCRAYLIFRDLDLDAGTYSNFEPPRQKHNHKKPAPEELEVKPKPVEPILFKGRFLSNLKLVDDDGNEIRGATMEDILAPPDPSTFANHVKVDRSIGETVNFQQAQQDEDIMDNDNGDVFEGEDFQTDDFNPGDVSQINGTEAPEAEASIPRSGQRIEDEDEPQTSNLIEKLTSTPLSFKTLTSASGASKRTGTNRNAKMTGELCCICGDHLISSEASICNEETFRKACTYLNVRSERNWFPNGKFHSFCELCSKEIMRIHDLYRKVEEIQALIFRKVEGVEKSVVDAEIVDNWMNEQSTSTAKRFEGFRKQVMINYRNKLKLRRTVRECRKTGLDLSEAVPVTTARMFATDPAPTITHNDNPTELTETSPPPESIPPPLRRSSRRKIKKTQTHVQEDSEPEPEVDADIGFDDDAQSVASVQLDEVKFWHEDPNKLIGADDGDDRSQGNDQVEGHEGIEDDDLPCGDDDLMNQRGVDPDYNPENDDDDRVAVKKSSSVKRNTKTLDFKFPETVLRRDGRMFMQGIEIIKNPPGHYPRRPYSISFTCGACGKVVSCLWKVRVHICGHHLRLYKCKICSKQYAEPRDVERHMQRVHKDRGPDQGNPQSTSAHESNVGSNEDFVGGDDDSNSNHIPENEDGNNAPVEPILAPLRKFTSLEFPDTHLRPDGRIFMQGIEIIKNLSDESSSIASFTCGACDKVASSFWKIRVHICGHHLGLYRCTICSKQYSEPREVERHMQNVHLRPDQAPVFTCSVCEKPFKGHLPTKEHIWSHFSEEEKRDPENQKYKPLSLKRKDTCSVGASKSYICSFCSKTFNHLGHLKQHEMSHSSGSGPDKFQCQSCGRLCSSKKTLRVHESRCGKKALGMEDATTTYPCRYCPKRYSSISARSKHRSKYHRKRN